MAASIGGLLLAASEFNPVCSVWPQVIVTLSQCMPPLCVLRHARLCLVEWAGVLSMSFSPIHFHTFLFCSVLDKSPLMPPVSPEPIELRDCQTITVDN